MVVAGCGIGYRKRFCSGLQALCVGLLLCSAARGRTQSTDAGRYAPVQVPPREHASYVLPDGSIQVVTCAAMAGVVKSLNELYASTHPGVKFTLLVGDNYSAMAALTFDRSAVGPIGSEYTRIGLGDNLKIAAEPLGIRIAHASLTPGPGVPALGVIVHTSNPIASLSMTQLMRIFAVGGPGGDIATWGQAGVSNTLKDREIDPVGPFVGDEMDSDDPQAGEFLSLDKMNGLNMNHRYAAMAHYADVVQRVSEDPAAIGIVALNVPLSHVKVIGLKTDTGSPQMGTATVIASGRYALDRFIYLYLRLGKDAPLDAFGKEYMRMVLSDDGQRVIAASVEGYIPLNAGELAEERAKLNR